MKMKVYKSDVHFHNNMTRIVMQIMPYAACTAPKHQIVVKGIAASSDLASLMLQENVNSLAPS